MTDESRTSQPEAGIHENHYCDQDGCTRWGCYGFEESRSITLWYCTEHQPSIYRNLKRHGDTRLSAAEIADLLK